MKTFFVNLDGATLELSKKMFGFMRADIDATRVGYLQYPEFRNSLKKRRLHKTRMLRGDWDKVIYTTVYWGSTYEPISRDDGGMVPLEHYVFYTSMREHFVEGMRWEDTEWLSWMKRLSNKNEGARRYENNSQITERLERLDALFSDMTAGLYDNTRLEGPILNIGRGGKIAIEDGRHRICVAKIAGLRKMRVRVNYVHSDLTLQRKSANR